MNWDAIIVAAIAAVPAAIIAWRTHRAVNSRMSEMLELARKLSAIDATIIEKAAEKRRKDAKK